MTCFVRYWVRLVGRFENMMRLGEVDGFVNVFVGWVFVAANGLV